MRRAGLALAIAVAAVPVARAEPPPLEALPAILHLQLDQRAAWRAYKDGMAEASAAQSHAAAAAARMNAMATPERLEATRQALRAEAADFDRQAAVTRAFYASLSPDQRSIFDEVTRMEPPPSPMHDRAWPAATASADPQPLRQPGAGQPLPPPAPR